MNFDTNVLARATDNLSQAGYGHFWAKYIVLNVLHSKPENVAEIARRGKGLFDGESLRNLSGRYADKPPLISAGIARGFVESVNLEYPYTPEQVMGLLDAAERKAITYEMIDAQNLVEITCLADNTQRNLAVVEKKRGARITELEKLLGTKEKEYKSGLKAAQGELAAAHAKINQQDAQLDLHADKLDSVLANLRREAEALKAQREELEYIVDIRKHQTLIPAPIFPTLF